MKVSIITVTYNSERFLQDCIDSVLNQTYSNIEYIIIDGGSTDRTIDIVKTYGKGISRVTSEADGGIYDAMNKGISLSTGDVIGFLNSDDFYIDQTVLAKVADLFDRTQSDAIYADLLYVHSINTNKVVRRWKSGSYNRKKFAFGWMPPHPTFFVKRKVLHEYGHFNLSFKTASDYELMLRLLFKNRISAAYLPEYIVKMRIGGLSNSSLRHRLFANREDGRAWKVNGLKPYFFTTILKPLRKVFQYL